MLSCRLDLSVCLQVLKLLTNILWYWLQVKLRCGTKSELRNVDEPSRCEYVNIYFLFKFLASKLIFVESRILWV